MCSFKFCARCGKHAWTYSPGLLFLHLLVTVSSCVDFFLWDFSRSTGREKSWRVQLSEHLPWTHLGRQHPASLLRCPCGPSASNSYHCPDANSIDLFAYFWTLYKGKYTAYAQCILSGSFTLYYVCELYSHNADILSPSVVFFFFPYCHLLLSDWITVYLPILFLDIWIISTSLLINYVFAETKSIDW